MDGGVGVAAPDGLLQGGEEVVVGVPLPIVAHCAALGGLRGVGGGDAKLSVLDLGCLVEKFHRIEGLAHIAAAGSGDDGGDLLLPGEGQTALLRYDLKPPLHRRFHVRRGEGFELKDRAAA